MIKKIIFGSAIGLTTTLVITSSISSDLYQGGGPTLSGLGEHEEYKLERGDILYEKGEGLGQIIGHIGIVGNVYDDGSFMVLETSDRGVIYNEYENFRKLYYQPSIWRVNLDKDIKARAFENAMDRYRTPMNWNWLEKSTTMNSTYCSSLVWEAYMKLGYDLDSNKDFMFSNIFTGDMWMSFPGVSPREIVNSPLVQKIKDLY